MTTHILPTIEEWSAGKDKFRVVANGFSRPFPLEVELPMSITPVIKFHKDKIGTKVWSILDKHNISFCFPEMRIFETDSINNLNLGPELTTLLIETESEDTSNWKIAAEEISAIYAEEGFGRDQIEVEIRNPRRMAWYASEILGDNADVLAACQSMKSELLDEIRAHCGSAWSSVGFHLRTQANSSYSDPDSRRPTVLVYCHKGSRCDFDALESALMKIMSKSNVVFYLELLPGSVISANSPLNKPTYLFPPSKQPSNGASIGLKGDTTRSGTLGGSLMLNLPCSLPFKVALTSFNLFSGIDFGGSPQKDFSGLNFKGASEIERRQVKYPAPSDIMVIIKKLEASCLDPTCPLHTHQMLKTWLDATTAPPLGHVIAASGQRVNENRHRMDWALIQISGCIGKNRPPPIGPYAISRDVPKDYIPSEFRFAADFTITNFSEVIPGAWVMKMGKSTRATAGFINRMPRIIQWEDQQESEEVDVVGFLQEYVLGGDSGSFVIDVNGNLVGLLIAADLVTSCAFITPIGEVLADANAITGGNLTLQ